MNSKNNYRGHALKIAVEITMLAIMLLANGASAATITVDDSGGADYTKIQDAIDNATAGDTIEVQSGTYFENVKVNKQLTLRGIGMPVVDGGGNDYYSIQIKTNGVTLEGFTATGSTDAGIAICSNNNTLNGNIANYNPYRGIFVGNCWGMRPGPFFNNTLSGNIANSNQQNGIYLGDAYNNRLIDNIANFNYGNNIRLDGSNNNTLSDNIASSSTGFSGIALGSSSNNILNGNIANSNEASGIIVHSSSSHNTLIGNNASNNLYGIFLLNLANYNTLMGNNANSNTYGIKVDNSYENMIYNNIFNNKYNVLLSKSDMMNKWNTSRQSGTNIVGGSYLGGNFWGNPSGTGFSQTCTDADSDGICDSSLTLDASNIDYLPLVYNPAITPTPTTTPLLVSAVTPNSRNAQVGMPVTIFKTVINGGTATATGVSITQSSSLPANINYQKWDGTAFTGSANTPVDMPAGSTANFVITINATSTFDSSSINFNVSSTNGATAPISAVNTLTMSASSVPAADIIMMATGNMDYRTAVGTATAFAVATMNVGTAAATGVSFVVSVPSSITGLETVVNQTNPITGAIIGPATGLTIAVGATPTFAVFLTPKEAITNDPANNRITLKLVDDSGKVIGAQSVAVSTT